MDDEDEFGDLYTDVLMPFTNSTQPIFSPKPDPNLQINREETPNFTIHPNISNQIVIPKVENPESDAFLGEISASKVNLIGGDELVQVKKEKFDAIEENVPEDMVLNTQNGELLGGSVRFSAKVEDSDKDVIFTNPEVEEKLEIDLGIDDLGSEPIIPGISGGGSFIPGVFEGGDEARRDDDDWDSDSEDDLQIVLNDNKSGPIGMDRNEGMGSDDDEDGEDLVIVTHGDQPHQPTEQLDWVDDAMQPADGEGKETGDTTKVNGGVVNTVGTRIGYVNHVYPSHHSQFKYVRPGAAGVLGGAIVGPGGAPGQVRPIGNMGLGVGRGRGDWRPMGIKTAPGMQRPFHSGFGMPPWGNNSSGRGFGSGLEFTLPSHKTVFDVNVDSFEEKPWRNPGVDISDFFNFELDEENWKDYCKQMEQLRLESTMQSRIRVYESVRTEQDYDPDLPPELAAAACIQDASADSAHLAKTDDGLIDLTGQGRGVLRARPPTIPPGRAIQVEGGYGERLPSIDTRPPRMRDSDAIIEIVLQGSGDDDPVAVDDAGNDVQKDDLKGGEDEEDIGQTEYFDRLPQPYNGRKREMVGRRDPFIGSENNELESNGVFQFPPEAPLRHNPGHRGRTPNYSDGRRPQRTTRDKYPRQTSERGNDVIPCESAQVNKGDDSDVESINEEQNPDATSLVAGEDARDSSNEHEVDPQNELELGDSSVGLDGEEAAKEGISPRDTARDRSPIHPIKRQKLSSRVEQPTIQDNGSVDGLRATRSSDDSKVRSGSSRDYQKRRDGGDEEVVQERRSRRMEDMKSGRDEDDHNFRRKDEHGRDGRQEMDRSRVYAKGREESYISYPYRDWDHNSTHLSRVKTGDIEKSRERDNSVGARQRREDDTHGRRLKDDTRKRDHIDEIGYRHRSKGRESEKIDKDEHLHSRKRLDNGDWRVHHDKDMGPRQRGRDDSLMIRHENVDDSLIRRRKEEEQLRREQTDKELVHGYRAREDTIRKKRERDDGLDLRKREEPIRVRDKPDDNLLVRHREESWRQRERDERRLKQPHEDLVSNREREGRFSVRSGRDIEDKSLIGNSRVVREDSKGLGTDKDYYKDKRRPSEHSKKSERVEDDTFQQHRGRDNVYAHENKFIIEDRNSRHERSSTHSDRLVHVSDSQLMQKERHRDSRRSKESDKTDQNTVGPGKRKQEDHNAHRSEKVSGKIASEQESGHVPHSSSHDHGDSRLPSSTSLSKKSSQEHDAAQQRHSSRKHKDDAPSDDEQQNLRRGRSKLERWTSNKDRDDIPNSLSAPSKSKDVIKNVELSSEVSEQPDDQFGAVGSLEDQHPVGEETSHDLEMKDAGTEQAPVGDERHLDTVAKLKKRSERFKTPMPSEKDITTCKKVESETLVSSQSEVSADAEVKAERPARKRRWISS